MHAIINERVRRYSKLSWKLTGSGSFCLRNRMPVCSINRLICERVSMPGPHRCTKRQAGDYRLPHVHILLSWGSTGQFGASYSAVGALPEVDVSSCGAAPVHGMLPLVSSSAENSPHWPFSRDRGSADHQCRRPTRLAAKWDRARRSSRLRVATRGGRNAPA